ncbi:ornithine cyclodeaminase family protein [Alicyclobacillus dauci]|uniref:Ornithine cyclodeaminase family protein n=1 Tax=Alicyclobacillus dauci TaxID=1475485 RepID=A0ABY6Z1Q8_9BACL|nr:ornithine cyclodeaminase family protein [Alicyclobacillus dauci]WAH35915.1 ornithine cyclodeaminase family protein [Alicyclobacillus dauci]
MSELVCLSQENLLELITLPVAIKAVQDAYIAHVNGNGLIYPVVREPLDKTSVFGIKSGYLVSKKILGLKAAGFWGNNRSRGEESHQATILIVDPDSGKPRAFLDGNYITTIRTAAAGALGIELFAAKDITKLAVIGTGHQGIAQTKAALHVRPGIQEIRCYSRSGNVQNFIDAFSQQVTVKTFGSPDEAIKDAEVVITTTASTEPLVALEALQPGVHVNAIGSDTAGKSELHESVLHAARVFVDDETQSRSIGELQGLPTVEAVPIGKVLTGELPGRQSNEQITVFDSTGIALQDLTTAAVALELAKQQNIGARLSW